MKKKVMLACQELVAGDKFGRAMFALITGKKVENFNIIEASLQSKPQEAIKLLNALYEIVSDNSESFPSNTPETVLNLKKIFNYNGVLVVLSGPSASGKDQIILDCIDILEGEGFSTDVVHKYSTRKKRIGEISFDDNNIEGKHLDKYAYYKFGEERFESEEGLFFLYEKYEHKYAFSEESIRNGYEIDVQFIVFGDATKFTKFVTELRKQTNKKIISCLLYAEEDTLHRRQNARHYLTSKEKEIRIKEMRKDVSQAKVEHIKNAYDLCLPNGRDNSIGEVEKVLIQEIKKHLLMNTSSSS